MHCVAPRAVVAAGVFLSYGASALAQTTVTMPDTSMTTAASAVISEQARITVPAGIAFNVTNIGAITVANPAAVTIDQVVHSSAAMQLRISLKAATPSFAPPPSGGTSWPAGAVSWNAASWTAASGVSGTLSDSVYNLVAVCSPGAAGCSTAGLTFSLAPEPAVKRSGTHTLVVTWKFESIGS